jgi:methyl-accepting chemotaxis protein
LIALISTLLAIVSSHVVQASEAETTSGSATSDKTEQAFLMLVPGLIVITAISMLTGTLVVKAISKRVGGDPGEVVRIVRSIVAGNLVPTKIGHPIAQGSILAEMQLMQGTLSTMVNDIHQQSDDVALVAQDIGSASETLHDRTLQASTQLAQSASATSDLSDKASQTADMARQASTMATAASQVASKGGEAVGRVVDTKQQINDSTTRQLRHSDLKIRRPVWCHRYHVFRPEFPIEVCNSGPLALKRSSPLLKRANSSASAIAKSCG